MNEKNLKRIVEILLGLIVIGMVFTLLIGILYAMPIADDFSFYRVLKGNKLYPNVPLAALSQAANVYFANQGAWFTNNLDMFVVGVTGLNVLGVRIYLAMAYALFLYSIITLICQFKNVIVQHWKTSFVFLLMAIILFVGMNLTPVREEFYWLIGAGGYTVPFSVALIGIKNFAQALGGGQKKKLVVSSICLFMASGGALNIAGFGCATAFCMALLYFIKEKKTSNKSCFLMYLPFALGTLSALINVAAPGNYKRLSFENTSGINIPAAIVDTIRQIVVRVYALCKYNYFILALVILFFVLLVISDVKTVVTGKQLAFAVLSSLFVLFVSFFPVCLGYGRTTSGDRILFLVDLEIVLAAVFCMLVFVLWLKGLNKELYKSINWISLIPILILLSALNINVTGIGNMMMYKTLIEFTNGTLAQFSQNSENVLEGIMESTENNVVLHIDYVDSEVSLGLGLSPDKDHWVNKEMSLCFGKESISLIYDIE